MGSHQKKESEGIALLSIYGDEDDDMEDQIHQEGITPRNPEEQEQDNFENGMVFERSITTTSTTTIVIEEVTAIFSSGSTPNHSSAASIERQQEQIINENFTPSRVLTSRVSVTSKDSLASPIQEQKRQHERLGIVDYGHDETAMSPEAEDGDIEADDGGTYRDASIMDYGDVQDGVGVLTDTNQETPGQISEHENDLMIDILNELKTTESEKVNMVTTEEDEDMDPLAKFLPPPLMAKCSEKLQEKIVKFLNLKKTTGRSYNSEVRNRKEYRNPDFLLHAVTYQDIDQIGSCFSKGVFDPHGYDKCDFYDELEADRSRETERKEQVRKKSQKLDFISGGTQPGVVPTPKLSIPIPGLPTADGGGLNTASGTNDVARDGRHNKKSKWDKNPMPSSGSETVSAAPFLSAANAGPGYSVFAQQRRREVEDRRSSEKKIERRS